MIRHYAALLALLSCPLLEGCRDKAPPVPAEAPPPPPTAAALLADSLRAHGMEARADSAVTQPFIPVPGQLVQVDGEYVQLYELGGAAEAEALLRRLRGGGTGRVDWIGTPHFFRRGPLLALYVGESEAVLASLRATLGPEEGSGR